MPQDEWAGGILIAGRADPNYSQWVNNCASELSPTMIYRCLAVAVALALSLLGQHEVSGQTTQVSPIQPNDPDFVMKAAAIRALAGRSHRRGGASGPAQGMAAQQMAAQQAMIRQQQAAAELAAAKRAEKKAKVRAAAEEMREKKEARKKKDE
jgi:hypothetical protein